MKFSFRHLFNIGVVVIMALIVITALGYDRQTRMLPLIVSVPVLILAVILTVMEFRESLRKPAHEEEKEGEKKDGAGEKPGESVFAKEINVSLWVLAMFISLYLFGFILTTFFYTFLSLKVRSHYRWLPSLGVAAGCLAFLYGVLITALKVELYQGVITIALRKALLGY